MMNLIIILLLFRSLSSTEPQEKTRVKRSLNEFNKTTEVTNLEINKTTQVTNLEINKTTEVKSLEIKQDLSFATNFNFNIFQPGGVFQT